MPFAWPTNARAIHLVIDTVELGASDEAGTPAVIWTDIDSSDVALDLDVRTLQTQGTTQLHEKDRTNAIRVNITNEVFHRALARASLQDPTTSGVTGVSERYGYDGSFRSKDFSLRATYKGTNADTGVEERWRLLIHKMQPRSFLPVVGAPAMSVPNRVTTMQARQATTDLLGVAIPGLKNATKGDYFAWDLLT